MQRNDGSGTVALICTYVIHPYQDDSEHATSPHGISSQQTCPSDHMLTGMVILIQMQQLLSTDYFFVSKLLSENTLIKYYSNRHRINVQHEVYSTDFRLWLSVVDSSR